MMDFKWQKAVLGTFDVNFPNRSVRLELVGPTRVEIAVALAWAHDNRGGPPFGEPSERFRINKLAPSNVLLELLPA
jgi:hypothetical protein